MYQLREIFTCNVLNSSIWRRWNILRIYYELLDIFLSILNYDYHTTSQWDHNSNSHCCLYLAWLKVMIHLLDRILSIVEYREVGSLSTYLVNVTFSSQCVRGSEAKLWNMGSYPPSASYYEDLQRVNSDRTYRSLDNYVGPLPMYVSVVYLYYICSVILLLTYRHSSE